MNDYAKTPCEPKTEPHAEQIIGRLTDLLTELEGTSYDISRKLQKLSDYEEPPKVSELPEQPGKEC